ncbi:hypothetical protein CN934_24995 [Ensifer sp. MMN_5]|nr:hypothetical protein CN934_24995 [Ensifer sp. MMN_5]
MMAGWEPTSILSWLTLWGACVSTGLAGIKIWETFWKDRIRLDTTHLFVGEGGPPSEISVANLTSLPVMVSSWQLVWEPKVLRWWVKRLDCTPDENWGFTIDRYSVKTLEFDEERRFGWGYRVSRHRTLCLYLRTYGRKQPLRLVIT